MSKKFIEPAMVQEVDLRESIAFRISPKDKAEFVALCKDHNLSIGKVLRKSFLQLLKDLKEELNEI